VVGGAAAEAGGVGSWRRPWMKDEICGILCCFPWRHSHEEFGEICFFFSWRDSHGEKRKGRRAAIHFGFIAFG
jgi:hypothetical protein